jgi:transcriptional regulator with XRE-family HTH domain
MIRLGRAIQLLRAADGKGVRETAKEIGISPATVSRFEHGKPVDIRGLVKILEWLVRSEP